MDTLLMLAVLPAALLLFFVYRLDPVEKEPPKLLGMLLFLGVISVVPAIILETIFSDLFLAGKDENAFTYLVIENFFGIALIEELCKFVFLSLRTWKHPAFTYVFDGIVYAVFVSLGFAIAENIMYVFEFGFETGVMRAFTAIPGHCVFAVFMGYLYGEAKFAKVKGYGGASVLLLILAFIVPVLSHGLYDLLASLDSDLSLILFFAALAGMVALGIVILKLASKEQKCIYPYGNPAARKTQAQPYPQHPYVQQPMQPQQSMQPQQYGQPVYQQPAQQQPNVQQQPYTQQQYTQPAQAQYQRPMQQQAYQQQMYVQQPVQPQYQPQAQKQYPQYPQQNAQQQQQAQAFYQQQPTQQQSQQQPMQQQYQQQAQLQYGQTAQQQYQQPYVSTQQQGQQPIQQPYQQPVQQQQRAQQSPYPQRPQSGEGQ